MKRFVLFLFLTLLSANSQAGWYRVTNYAGNIGKTPIHMSLQFYNWNGKNESAQGSYYYDKHMQPIKIYGEFNSEGELVLRNVVKEKQVFNNKGPAKTITEYGDEIFTLKLSNDAASGTWGKKDKKDAVLLNKNGFLNDEVKAEHGAAEIPFWTTTNNHAFIGVYLSSSDCGRAYLDKIKVIEIKTGRLLQELGSEGDCQAGNVMTSIYMTIEKYIKNGHQFILVNYSDVRYGYTEAYQFNSAKKKYQRVNAL